MKAAARDQSHELDTIELATSRAVHGVPIEMICGPGCRCGNYVCYRPWRNCHKLSAQTGIPEPARDCGREEREAGKGGGDAKINLYRPC